MRCLVGCLGLLLVFVAQGLAQDEVELVTVDDCVRLALAGNRRVNAAREQAESARQSATETGTRRWPRVSTSATYARIEGAEEGSLLAGGGAGAAGFGSAGGAGAFSPSGGIEEYSSAGVSVTEPLADQVGLGYQLKIARLEAAIAAMEQASAENAVGFAARQAYYRALTFEKTAESVTQTITELESTLKLVRSLKEAGRVLQRDVNKADIAVERAKLGLLRAQNALRSATSSLRDVLGLELDAPIAPAPTEAVEPFELTLDECIATAHAGRPDLRASQLGYEAARRGVGLARSAYVPSVGASVSYEWQDTDLTASEDSVTYGLSWSWDLWDWGGRRAAVRSAKAVQRAAYLAYRDARNQVALEVERLWLTLGVARQTIAVAKKDWDYATENVRVSREKYEAGTLLITDLLDDQTQLNDARIAYYVAIYEYAIALADLRRAMGER